MATFGGVVLVGLLLMAGRVLSGGDAPDAGAPPTTVAPRASTTSPGPSTTELGGGAETTMTAAQAAAQLKLDQERTAPGLAVGTATCPPGPYRVGHVMTCSIPVEDAIVAYRLEVTGDTTVVPSAVRPVIDTRKAAELVEAKEAGATADCGFPRVRQVDVGSTFSCTTARSTWDFTVRDQAGQLAGTRR